MPANEVTEFYTPGAGITGHCSAAVTGKRFVKISGNRQSTRAVSDATGGGNYQVAPAGNGQWALGVAAHDAAINTKVLVHCDPGEVLPVRAGAAIAAGEEVMSNANGEAIPYAAGAGIVPLGRALTGAGLGDDAEIRLAN